MPAVFDRRVVLRLASAGTAFGLMGHTPFRQWQVYRRKHLLIGTHKADPESYPLGKTIAGELAERLPESRARVTRGPDAQRLASLLTTGQLDVVLLRADEILALATGAPPFDQFGAVDLRSLAGTDGYHLVVRPDFPDHHAWRITAALPPMLEPAGLPSAPLHSGVTLQLTGEPMPEAPPASPPEAVDHVH